MATEIKIPHNNKIELLEKQKCLNALANLNTESLKKLTQLAQSPKGEDLLSDNWDYIKALI